MRRWQEIRMRQTRLLTEQEHTTPAHLEQIMKSGFSINDIKGLSRGYSEDAVEADEMLLGRSEISQSQSKRPSPKPRRKGSLSRYEDGSPGGMLGSGKNNRSTSEMDINKLENGEKDKKTRGRSPFRYQRSQRPKVYYMRHKRNSHNR